MQITHKINSFLYDIFPELAGGNIELIVQVLEKYYTYGPYKPKVSINDDFVTVEIDTTSILAQEAEYRNVISLCEKGKYSDAKLILTNLIAKNPTVSEYHRIMGQILSDEGEIEEAINCLIDALRWDSKNNYALIMMGNIFAREKDDVATALKYYDQSLIVNPNDNIAINNIGANLMSQNKIEEAKLYFNKALEINNEYPNTHFALGMIAEIENDLDSAFYCTMQAIKVNKSKDALYQNSVSQAFEIAKKIVTSDKGKKIFRAFRHKLEHEGWQSFCCLMHLKRLNELI